MDRHEPDKQPSSEQSSESSPRSLLLAPNLELDHAVGKGLEIATSVAYDILDLVASGNLREEQVEIKGLVRTKTNADRISHELFCERLAREFPQCAILSEESRVSNRVVAGTIPKGEAHFILDPIDGTIHLKEGDGQWLMNLGVVVDGVGKIGISVVPAMNKVYLGVEGRPSIMMNLDGTDRQMVNNGSSRESKVFGICDLLDLGGKDDFYRKWQAVAADNGATDTRVFGSAYSYLKVAEGELDVFVNLAGNFHWDTIAQQVILEGAGCRLVPIDWGRREIDVARAEPARYGLNFIKDDGHIAARNGMTIKIDPELRIRWTAVFD